MNKGRGHACGPRAELWAASRSSCHPLATLWETQSPVANPKPDPGQDLPGNLDALPPREQPHGVLRMGLILQELYSADSAVPAALPAAHTIVPSALIGHSWGRSGCLEEVGTRIWTTRCLWPPFPRAHSPQLPLGKRCLPTQDTSGS